MDESIFQEDTYQLWLLLTGTRSAITRARQRIIGHYTHHNQAAALVAIWTLKGTATPAEITRRLYLEKHTVSELLTRLEKKGYITKRQDEEVRTRVRLEITQKGRDYCLDVTRVEVIRDIMSALTPDQQITLRVLLQRLRDKATRYLNDEA